MQRHKLPSQFCSTCSRVNSELFSLMNTCHDPTMIAKNHAEFHCLQWLPALDVVRPSRCRDIVWSWKETLLNTSCTASRKHRNTMRCVEKKTDQVLQRGQLGSQRYELLSEHGGPDLRHRASRLVVVRSSACSSTGFLKKGIIHRNMETNGCSTCILLSAPGDEKYTLENSR